MDVPFAGSSQVMDSRVHGYATAQTYVVSVVAFDSSGNIGTGYWGLSNAFPTSCVRAPGMTTSNHQPMVLNTESQPRYYAYDD
jgi:hypothetical protein